MGGTCCGAGAGVVTRAAAPGFALACPLKAWAATTENSPDRPAAPAMTPRVKRRVRRTAVSRSTGLQGRRGDGPEGCMNVKVPDRR